jgi:hypothetical protein
MGRVGWVTRRQALAGLGVAAVAGCGAVNAAVRQGSLPKPPGAVLWRISVPGGVLDPEVAGGLLCVAGSDLRAYRPGTGERRGLRPAGIADPGRSSSRQLR